MSSVQIYLQRRRKLITRIAALLVLGLGGLFVVLPRADAHGVDTATASPGMLAPLMLPERLASRHFGVFYRPHLQSPTGS